MHFLKFIKKIFSYRNIQKFTFVSFALFSIGIWVLLIIIAIESLDHPLLKGRIWKETSIKKDNYHFKRENLLYYSRLGDVKYNNINKSEFIIPISYDSIFLQDPIDEYSTEIIKNGYISTNELRSLNVSSYRKCRSSYYNNIIFTYPNTGERKMLFDRPIKINRYINLQRGEKTYLLIQERLSDQNLTIDQMYIYDSDNQN